VLITGGEYAEREWSAPAYTDARKRGENTDRSSLQISEFKFDVQGLSDDRNAETELILNKPQWAMGR